MYLRKGVKIFEVFVIGWWQSTDVLEIKFQRTEKIENTLEFSDIFGIIEEK